MLRFVLLMMVRHNIFPIISAGIDVGRVISGGLNDCSSLQDVLMGIAFCSLEKEFPDAAIPKGLAKVQQILNDFLYRYVKVKST